MENINCEVAVVGGGLAGICAAISAARHNCKVVLLQDRPVLGGNSSSEIRVWSRGATGGGNLFSEEMGVLGDLKLRNLYTNIEGNPILWDEVLLDAVMQEKNIKLLLNTHITEVNIGEDKIIKSVSGFQLGSEIEYEISADMYIDSTGDCTLGYKAGANYVIGKEASNKYGESFAPKKDDSTVLGSTIFFNTRKSDKPVKFIAPNYAYDIKYIEKLIGNGGRIVNEKMSGVDYWWFEFGGIINTIENNQDIYFELKRVVLGVWNYIKNSGEFDADNLTLEWIGNVPGKRESRRIVGEYVLNVNDILENRKFDDAVCYGGWYLDYHPSEGIFADDNNCTQIPVNIYQIPLRCFYTHDVKNLMFAGRDISVSHAAFASTRIMNTCGLTGQVSGTTSAYVAKNNISLINLKENDIKSIQEMLIEDDMFIPGIKSENPRNKAANAEITVSSVNNKSMEECNKFITLKDNTFVVLAIPKDCENIELYMKWKEDTNLNIKLSSYDIPSRYDISDIINKETLILNGKEKEKFVPINVPQEARGRFLVVNFEKNELISIGATDKKKTGYIIGEKTSSKYLTPSFKINNIEGVYSKENIVNGQLRPYGGLNLWMPKEDDDSPWIEFSWNSKIDVSKILLYFNPELSEEITSSRCEQWNEHHMFNARKKMPEQLVKTFTVYCFIENAWVEVAREDNNWKRLYEVRLNGINTDRIKISFDETYGALPEIYEISIF